MFPKRLIAPLDGLPVDHAPLQVVHPEDVVTRQTSHVPLHVYMILGKVLLDVSRDGEQSVDSADGRVRVFS